MSVIDNLCMVKEGFNKNTLKLTEFSILRGEFLAGLYGSNIFKEAEKRNPPVYSTQALCNTVYQLLKTIKGCIIEVLRKAF